MEHPDARVTFRVLVENLPATIWRAIVHRDDLKMWASRVQNGVETLPQVALDSVYGDDDAQ
jgi:hypothetical protein